MASLQLPLMEWGGSAHWISKIHPTAFVYDSPYVVLGCNDGVVLKLSPEDVNFVSGGGSHAYPIDFLFKCAFEGECGKQDAYLCIDRMGSLLLLDALDGRCLLFNALGLEPVFDAVACGELLWVVQDDGVVKLVEMGSLKLLASHKEVKHGKIMSVKMESSLGLCMVYQQAAQSLIRVALRYDGAMSGMVKESEELLELQEEATAAEICDSGDVAYASSSAIYFPNGDVIPLENDQKYLSHRIIANTREGKLIVGKLEFPKKALRRKEQFLFKSANTLELVDVLNNKEISFTVRGSENGVSKTWFDHSTLTVYKGYANGCLKRVIAANVFSEQDSVEFEGAHSKAPVATIYHSRRSGRIWTGHENGDYCQWDPITRHCTSIIKGAHSEAPVIFLESPEGWEPKTIVAVAADQSLSVASNTNSPKLLSDLPLETGRALCVLWTCDSRLVVQEQEAFAKVWDLKGEAECHLLEPLVTAEAISACKHSARHVDELQHVQAGLLGDSSDAKGVIRAVNEHWCLPWAQLYLVDLRKLLSNELQNTLGREEEMKMCRAVLHAVERLGLCSIGYLKFSNACRADNRISFGKGCGDRSPFMNSIRQLSFNALSLKLESNEQIGDVQPCLLSFLCKYWQDPNVFVKSAVRKLLADVLSSLSEEKLNQTVAYWSKLLPGEQNRTMHRAAVVMGLMATMDLVRDSLLVKHIAETLLSLLVAEEGRDMFRMAAMELLASGLSKWQDHVHVGSLFRLVLSWAFALSPLRNMGGPADSAEFNYSIVAESFAAILQWDAVHGGGRVIAQWCKDLLQSALLDRIISMELLHRMLSKKQHAGLLVLTPYLGMIVETIVKLLDPSHAEDRERLRPTMIPLLHALVTTLFRDVCVFDQTTQYLAVISSPKLVIVYDLKSATVLSEHPTTAETNSFAKIALKGQTLGALVRSNDGACQLSVFYLGNSHGFLFFRSKPAAPVHSPPSMAVSHTFEECSLQFANSHLQLCCGPETLIKLKHA